MSDAKKPNMNLFVLHADKVVATPYGHTIEFKKGVPTHVPKEAIESVVAAGAIASDQEALHAEEEKPVVPTDEDRKALIVAGIEDIVRQRKREDFGASGAPHVKSLSKALGFEVFAEERDTIWNEYKLEHKL